MITVNEEKIILELKKHNLDYIKSFTEHDLCKLIRILSNIYLNDSGKIKLVSVASIKFMIMMQKCKDNLYTQKKEHAWDFDDIIEHQEKMLALLVGKER